MQKQENNKVMFIKLIDFIVCTLLSHYPQFLLPNPNSTLTEYCLLRLRL